MEEKEKIDFFYELMQKHRKNGFEIVKEYLVSCNPNAETVKRLHNIIENFSLLGEYDMREFLRKWSEYVEMREKSKELIMKDDLDKRFLEIMSENFRKEKP